MLHAKDSIPGMAIPVVLVALAELIRSPARCVMRFWKANAKWFLSWTNVACVVVRVASGSSTTGARAIRRASRIAKLVSPTSRNSPPFSAIAICE
eukprot:2925675-Prymnesium_polylepis.2